MHKYRKKPVEIEAVQLHKDNVHQVMDWVGNDALSVTQTFDDGINIKVRGGIVLVPWGSYVVRGVEGEHYPCDPDIFHKTYEKVEHWTQPEYWCTNCAGTGKGVGTHCPRCGGLGYEPFAITDGT